MRLNIKIPLGTSEAGHSPQHCPPLALAGAEPGNFASMKFLTRLWLPAKGQNHAIGLGEHSPGCEPLLVYVVVRGRERWGA